MRYAKHYSISRFDLWNNAFRKALCLLFFHFIPPYSVPLVAVDECIWANAYMYHLSNAEYNKLLLRPPLGLP